MQSGNQYVHGRDGYLHLCDFLQDIQKVKIESSGKKIQKTSPVLGSIYHMQFLLIRCVVRLLCISTSFRVLLAPESWSKHFFQPFFNLICSSQSFFSDFTAEINFISQNILKNVKKKVKNQPKKDNFEVPPSESTSFCMSTSFGE